MEKQQALTLLGLNEQYSAADLTSAVVAKKQLIQQKRDAAPTEALKAKFEMMLLQLDEAAAVLQSASTQTKASSPLSQTKLADLPSMAAGDAEQLVLQQGQVLAGRYEIKELLGQGGMGAVYRAFDKSMSRDIALKVLLPSLIKNDTARERFLNEARISQQLSHPNIVNVFDVQNDGDLYFLTMELLEGQDLRQVMENRKLARQPFSVEEAQDIAKALSDALGYAHKYTIHRDLKPENVWLTDEGIYKLMDFGIAQVQSTSQRTKTGAAMGTAYYMAPEQLNGQKDIDGRADQYALAVMLYELLSGEVPAGMIEPLGQLRRDVPKTMVAAVHQALAAKPENRFATLAEFIAALTSKRSSPTMPSLPWKPIGIAAGVLVALLGVGGVLSSGSMDFKSFLPKSQAELSQQKAELARLLGQINVTKKRLEEGRRKLENDVRDAERDKGNTARLAELTHWHTITESALFNGTQITELEGELAMAEAFNRDGSLTQAKTSYEKVLAGYTVLLDEFTSAEFLKNAAAAAAQKEKIARLMPGLVMVAIPAGSFRMGDTTGNGDDNENPVHSVSISSVKMSKTEVTFAQYDAYAEAAGVNKPSDEGWGRGNRPVINVSWDEAVAYTRWLSQQTGKRFRLPTEAEWEYAARAGSTGDYSWGNSIHCNQARYGRRYGGECSNSNDGTVAVGGYSPNGFGLHDMHGNVWEWVQDCWNDSYSGAPSNGSAWQSGECSHRVMRGGSWGASPGYLRSAFRNGSAASDRNYSYGFRLVQD